MEMSALLKNNKEGFRLEYIAAAAVILLLSLILLPRPIIGVADNGDFARIMNSAGLHYLTDDFNERYFGYVNRLYGIGPVVPFGGGYFSTQILPVLLAVLISGLFSNMAVFDIRFLAVLYILIMAAVSFYIVRGIRKRSAPAAVFAVLLFIFIFCDTAYTSYFNSLYGEPVTFVFLLLMTATALTMTAEEKPSMSALILFSAGAFFFAGAKVQNVPAGVLAALMFLRISSLRTDKRWRVISSVSAAAVILVSIAGYICVARDIKICNKYQTVFFGILKGSGDPQGDLEELGLDPSLAVLAGTNYFMKDYPVDIRTPEFQKKIDEKVNHTKVAGFYIRHPDRLLEKLEISAYYGFKLNQEFGNYEKYKDTGYKQVTNVFSNWSRMKMEVLPHTLLFVLCFFALVLAVLIYEYGRAKDAKSRLLIEFFGFIALTGIMQFILPVIGDGEADLSKHLFLFNVCFDIFAAAAPVYAAAKIAAHAGHSSS